VQAQAKGVAINSALFAGEVPASRWLDDNGFLHITLRFMRTGLLKYAPIPETFPDGVPPECVGPDGFVTVLVEPEDLAEPESLASLAGLDILRTHEWATPDGTRDTVGSVAGIPQFDGEFVTGEAVIKDAETIRRLQLPDGDPEKLTETSAGYGHVIQWDGEPYAGKAYAGRQRTLRYNHAVLLPEGEGRCGATVRVTNANDKKKGGEDMSEAKGVSWFSRVYGRVFNANDEREAEEMTKMDEKIASENEGGGEGGGGSAATAEELLAQLKESNESLQAMTAANEELKAQLTEIKAQIESEIGGDNIEEKAEEIAGEREEIAEVMNSKGVMDKAAAMNALKEKKLRGVAAKVFAMNSIREKQGREPMAKEQAESAIAVNAAWDVLKESPSAPAKPPVGYMGYGAIQKGGGVALNGFDAAKNMRDYALDQMFGKNRKKEGK
jgi:hypothetical protein